MIRYILMICLMPMILVACTTNIYSYKNGFSDLVELRKEDPSFIIDPIYSTEKNFVGVTLYSGDQLFLRKKTAQKLAKINLYLKSNSLLLKIWDAYRPLSVQRAMWARVPDARYVANPNIGSNHNRGCAVDVTLVDINGVDLKMPTEFDDFTDKAHRDYFNLSSEIINNRQILESAMVEGGFTPFATEWWHFDDTDCNMYSIMDVNPWNSSTIDNITK